MSKAIMCYYDEHEDEKKNDNLYRKKPIISEDEIMGLRYENTKLKLVLKDIIEDLEREAERGEPIIIRQEYVEWIKANVDLRLNGEKNEKEKIQH